MYYRRIILWETINMAQKFAKEHVRICADISKERHEIVKKFNENNPRPISLSTIAKNAIEAAIDEVERELAEKNE